MTDKFRLAAKQVRAAFKVVRETARDHVILKREGPRGYAVSPSDDRPPSQPGTRVVVTPKAS
jgi:hypothetical protein